MFAAVGAPVLVRRRDRRATRIPYPVPVLVNGQRVAARDISATGLSIVVKPTLALGDVVRLTLAGSGPDEVCTSARVSRVEARPEGFVVGLQFIE